MMRRSVLLLFFFVLGLLLPTPVSAQPDFAMPVAPVEGDKWQGRMDSQWHTGKDLYAIDFNLASGNDSGKPVLASAAGRVVLAKWNDGPGKQIIIDHGGGFRTYYAHLQSYSVRDGESVQQGQIIGKVDNTGANTTGPHLHFAVRRYSNGAWRAYRVNFQDLEFVSTVSVSANSPVVSAGREITTQDVDEVLGTVIPGGLQNIFIWAIGIGGVVAFGIIVYGGILYMSSGGNPSRVGDAWEWIKAAIYGLLLLFLGWILLYTINPTLVGQ